MTAAKNKGHAAQISDSDTLVGKVTDRLHALDIAENTVVLVTRALARVTVR